MPKESEERRIQRIDAVVELLRTGATVKGLAKENGVTIQTIYNWINRTYENLDDAIKFLNANGREADARLLVEKRPDSSTRKQTKKNNA